MIEIIVYYLRFFIELLVKNLIEIIVINTCIKIVAIINAFKYKNLHKNKQINKLKILDKVQI